MSTLKIITTIFLGLSTLFPPRVYGNQHAASLNTYIKAHSLAENSFDPRDGWEIANITDFPYKYQRTKNSNSINTRRGTPIDSKYQSRKKTKTGGIVDNFKHVLDEVWEGLRGIGESQNAVITWCVPKAFLFLTIPFINYSI
jgi:hypothetical protein